MSKPVFLNQNNPRWAAYRDRMVTIEQADFDKKSACSSYWWSVWEIYDQQLYLDGGFETWEAWLKDFSLEPFGDSRSNVYNHIKAVRCWKKMGFRNEKIKSLLGSWVYADAEMTEWFDRDLELKPRIAEALAEEGKSPKEIVNELRGLSPSEARTHISNYVQKEHIFPTDEWLYDERTGTFYVNVRRESDQDGLMNAGTLAIVYTPLHPKSNPGDGKHIPQPILDWLKRTLRLAHRDS